MRRRSSSRSASSSLRNRANVTPSDCARVPSEASDERGSPPQKSGRRPPRVAAGAEQPPSPALLTKREETAVPTSLQYPLERERALGRRWHRLLQRTVAPKKPRS